MHGLAGCGDGGGHDDMMTVVVVVVSVFFAGVVMEMICFFLCVVGVCVRRSDGRPIGRASVHGGLNPTLQNHTTPHINHPQEKYGDMGNCFRTILKEEGPAALFKGACSRQLPSFFSVCVHT